MDTYTKKIRKMAQGLIPEITKQEMFTSSEFLDHATFMVNSALADIKRSAKINLIFDPEKVACTNGRDIYYNPLNTVQDFYKDFENAFDAAMGILFHEVAHIRYSDFDSEWETVEQLEKGILPWSELGELSSEEQDGLDKLEDLLSDDVSRPLIVKCYTTICNIIDDPHDEEKMKKHFGRYVGKAIDLARETLWLTTVPLELQDTAPSNRWNLMMSLILQYARFGDVSTNDDDSRKTSKYYHLLEDCMAYLDDARETDDYEIKEDDIIRTLMVLAPFINESINDNDQKDDSGQGNQRQQSGGNSPHGTQDSQNGNDARKNKIQQMMNELDKALKNASATSESTGNKSSTVAGKDDSSGQSGDSQEESSGGGQVQQVIEKLAERKAEEKEEKQRQAETLAGIKSIDANSEDKEETNVRQTFSVGDWEQNEYRRRMEVLGPVSKRLQKKVKEAFRDLKDGERQKHRLIGKGIEVRDAYRVDQRYFTNNKFPVEMPTMAISILVDNSGSMSGERINKSIDAALLLYDFGKGLGIPVSVAGHDYGYQMNYDLFIDFDAHSSKEQYKILHMNAGGCNRDGKALEISAERLAKRDEEIKLLFIISDGRPNAPGYGGESAKKHIQSVVRKAKHKGVEIVACAIGSDKDTIYDIYGEDFLNVEDLNMLPTKLVKIVRKRLVA